MNMKHLESVRHDVFIAGIIPFLQKLQSNILLEIFLFTVAVGVGDSNRRSEGDVIQQQDGFSVLHRIDGSLQGEIARGVDLGKERVHKFKVTVGGTWLSS